MIEGAMRRKGGGASERMRSPHKSAHVVRKKPQCRAGHFASVKYRLQDQEGSRSFRQSSEAAPWAASAFTALFSERIHSASPTDWVRSLAPIIAANRTLAS